MGMRWKGEILPMLSLSPINCKTSFNKPFSQAKWGKLILSDTRKHIWQIINHFIAFFELNLVVILSFALIKPAACISQIKNFFKLEVVLS